MIARTSMLSVLAGSTVLSVVVPGIALADHQGYWNNDDDFYVRVSHMVDFDQRRAVAFPFTFGLPGDGGMHCVPTSSADLLAYVERHGYADNPGVGGPGVMDWHDADDLGAYNAATNFIDALGLEMGTTADEGTTSVGDWHDTMVDRLDPNLFDVLTYGQTDTWSPKAIDIAGWIGQNGIVSFCYGRWEIGSGGENLIERKGGHCVVATKVDKRSIMGYDESEYVINFADPASDSANLIQQSPYENSVQRVEDMNYFVVAPGEYRRMSRIMFATTSANHRLIDVAQVVLPKGGWGVYPDPSTVTLFGGGFEVGGGSFTPGSYQAPGPIIATELSPDRGFGSVVVDVAAGAQLLAVDPTTGVFTPIETYASGISGIAHHRDRTLFVAVNGDGSGPAVLKRIEMDADLPAGATRLSWETALPLPAAGDLAFADATDTVYVMGDYNLDGSVDGIDAYDASGMGAATHRASFTIPQSTFPGSDHDEWIDVMPGATPGIIVSHSGSGLITHYEEVGGAMPGLVAVATLGLGGPVDGVSAGEEGQLFVVRGGVVEEFARSGGTYVPVAPAEASPFVGQAVLGGFQSTRSRTNFVAELHSGPGWENIQAAEIDGPDGTASDCIADLAAPFEVLDLADITAFVQAFVGQQVAGDINLDGVFDLADLTAYVRMFLDGCD